MGIINKMGSFAPHNFSSLRPPQSTGRDPSVRKIVWSFAFLIVFFIFLFFLINNKDEKNIKFVKIAGENVRVELALNKETQERGLSGRKKLGENEGMLFVFDHPAQYPFWMKDMNFPIDIIWIDENSKVVYIKKDAQPKSYPAVFSPDRDSKYVLEVVAGFSDKYNIKIGDKVESYFLK